MGRPWNGDYIFASGDLVEDLTHNFFLETGALGRIDTLIVEAPGRMAPPASTRGRGGRLGSGGALLLVGIAAGSLTWVTLLASGTAIARRALGDRAMCAADTTPESVCSPSAGSWPTARSARARLSRHARCPQPRDPGPKRHK